MGIGGEFMCWAGQLVVLLEAIRQPAASFATQEI